MRRLALVLGVIVAGCGCGFALNPHLDISQYAHTAWTRDGLSLGNIYAMAQTPDGYLWLGTEFGLFRFDGVRSVAWQPPTGQHLPDKNISRLLVTRDGTLWIGTFAGLVTWHGGKLTSRPELGGESVKSLLEDREGTVWAGTQGTPTGRLCAMRSGGTQCYGEDGAFGSFVSALAEDSSGTLWVAAQSGLWRWKPAPRQRYETPPMRSSALITAENGRLLLAIYGAELLQFGGDRVEPYLIRNAYNPSRLLRDREVNSNKLLRDRDGGLWIGTVERGLIHVYQGRTDVFSRSDGLSGDVVLSLFEDREGNIWAASTGGLDRFRELPVSTISVKQGLSSDATGSVLAARDGSVWIGAHDGLTRWKNEQTTIFRKTNGLPDDFIQSLFQDHRGQIWVATAHGLAYFNEGRFITTNAIPGGELHSIAGDKAADLWVSESKGLFHLMNARLVELFPWSELGRHEQASVALCDERGVWLSFWTDGGVAYFRDGKVRGSYTPADGLGAGHVVDLHFDHDGALWAATQDGGLSRLKDGRITTLTSRNGLPCDAIHWTIEDDERSYWLYTACGLVRIRRSELESWIADPRRRIETTVWNAADGVRLRSNAATPYSPRVAKSTDGKLWFVTGEGVQVVDPRHLVANNVRPPVHIEQIVADHKIYWQSLPGIEITNVTLPPLVHDLQIDYTALSLVAPEKVHFKYKLEGQDTDWREVVNDREVQYSNLPPRQYRFRVVASNNSGVWNQRGDTLDFSVAPAYYQTNWFRSLCAAIFLALLWAAYQRRVWQLHMASEARLNERMRIARDLHDHLLQTVQGFMLRLQAVNEMIPPGRAKNEFEETLQIGDRAIIEGRRTVQDLRSVSSTSDLAQALRGLGDELASGDGATFRLVLEGPVRALHPIVRDEVYSIAREALRNAFKHAGATHIEAEISFGERRLCLRILDNGKGITPEIGEQGRAGHYGLAGMRERARQIGSKLIILSRGGTGTEVELSVPGSMAYAKPPGRSRFMWFRGLAG
ncbi:MAG: hypothetical protein JO270_15640 [Acidobacteriaceae bacterium]|nr:hypothetical protein [Acidobacteriaceae bacterium]